MHFTWLHWMLLIFLNFFFFTYFLLHWVLVATWGIFVAMHRCSCPLACRILVPQPGIKLTSPAMENRFLTTGPPGKSLMLLILCYFFCILLSHQTVCPRSGSWTYHSLFPPCKSWHVAGTRKHLWKPWAGTRMSLSKLQTGCSHHVWSCGHTLHQLLRTQR